MNDRRDRNRLLVISRASVRRAVGARRFLSLLSVGSSVLALATYWVLHLGAELHPVADSGIIEVNVQDAVHGRMLTGPYSRFGWNHPGPLLFYLLAPLYYATGRNPAALHLGVALLNGASAFLAVGVVRKLEGEHVARWAAGVAVLLLVGISPAELSEIWNPNVLAVPLVLFLVLCAAAWARRTLSWLFAAALAGSFLVQTHVSVIGVVGILLLSAAAGVAVETARRGEPPKGRRCGVVVGVLALVLVWAPPLFESFPRVPENFYRLGGSLLARGADATRQAHDVRSAVTVVVRQAATVPLGSQMFSPEAMEADTARVLVVLAGVVASLVALALGARRRKPFGAAVGLTSLVGLALGIASATRALGPLYSYLFSWCAALPVPGWIALGVVLLDREPRRGGARAAGVVVALGATAASAWFAVETARTPVSRFLGSRAAPAVAVLLTQRVPAIRTEGVEIVAPVSSYPDYAAVYATLRRQGVDAVVPPEWAGNFGRQHIAGAGGPPPRHVAYMVNEDQAWNPEPPGLAQATLVGTVAGMRVWLAERTP